MNKHPALKTIKVLLGIYSLALTIYTLLPTLQADLNNPYLLFLIPLPLFFLIEILKLAYRLFRRLDDDFIIDDYKNHRPPTSFNLHFLSKQTSPTFLITITLFSTAIGGTIIRVILG